MGLLDMFIERSNDEKKNTGEHEVVAARPVSRFSRGSSVPTPSPTQALTLTPVTTHGQPSPDIVNALESAVAKATPQEYTQFRAFFDSLAGVPEGQRYVTALNVAKAAKLSGDSILHAMDTRIAALDKEKTGFDQWSSKEQVTMVDEKEKAAAQAQARITALATEIQDLTTTMNQFIMEASANRENIASNAATFSASFETVKAKLLSERSLIASLITPTSQQ